MIIRILLAALFLAAALPLTVSANPSLRVDKAADIAVKHLRERGLDGQIYVASLTVEASSMTSGPTHWYARWSSTFPIDDNKRESGLRINMDGSLVRVVEGPNSARTRPKDHRARSDRPSILDLKH